MSMEIKHIVFDIGNVLIDWDVERAYMEQIPDAEERRWFLANICTPSWNIEQDRGREWTVAEDLLIEQHPEYEENIRTFRRNWHMMVSGEIDGSVAVLRSLLAQNYDVTMLTNFARDTLVEAKERFDFLNASRGTTVSAHIGHLKPHREIYDHHVREFGIAPQHSLFIDDSEKNVQGAIDAGWQAVHFINAKKLTSDLAELGLVV